MTRNLGTRERVLRLIAGLTILGLFGTLTPPWRYLTLIGLTPLGTALTGHCPVYHTLGSRRSAS